MSYLKASHCSAIFLVQVQAQICNLAFFKHSNHSLTIWKFKKTTINQRHDISFHRIIKVSAALLYLQNNSSTCILWTQLTSGKSVRHFTEIWQCLVLFNHSKEHQKEDPDQEQKNRIIGGPNIRKMKIRNSWPQLLQYLSNTASCQFSNIYIPT